ncbi:hypothetical protein ACLMO3_20235 [Yersinia enterocolitica]|uniref:hypothetical protein n=1 Tax=Yersinia enterocolitica TaxID=630 RepID=UPI00398D2F4A
MESILVSDNTIKVTLAKKYFDENNRYIVRVNSKHAMETNMGKAYYSSISMNKETVTIQRSWVVTDDDVITVHRTARAPGEISDTYNDIGKCTVVQ